MSVSISGVGGLIHFHANQKSIAVKVLRLSNLRLLLLLLLFFSLPACRSNPEERVKTLLSEADKIGDQQTKIFSEWAREFGQTFSEQNRAQFPANRDWLNSRAQKIIPRIDESSRLGNEAAAKFEEASRLMSNDQLRKGMASIAASERTNVEMEQLLKAQALLASDGTINDQKTYKEKFDHIGTLIQQKVKQKDEQFAEGKLLMLMPKGQKKE